MKTWVIEPRDALIARDGRPFTLGGRAKTLPFPYPSTTTGGTRTQAGLRDGKFDTDLIPQVKQIEVRGPLLVEVDNTGTIVEWFVHAPSDALLFEIVGKYTNAKLHQLSPRELLSGAITNLPCLRNSENRLQPVYLCVDEKSKPLSSAPRFWRWSEFEKWLLDPQTLANREHELISLGHSNPVFESRTHVRILSESQTASEGDLFQTSGLEFARRVNEEACAADRLALAIQTSASESLGGLSHLGGEHRIVCWREGKATRDLFSSKCPVAIQHNISDDKRCRVVLLTPAHFKEGIMPTWLCDKTVHGFEPVLKAIANSRYQVVSGWDFEKFKFKDDHGNEKLLHGRPKPTRRLVPAGSVLWFDLSNGDETQINAWIENVWMRSLSDDPQNRKDGFGLAVLGSWNKEEAKEETK